jgi:hypothetical protein
MPTVEAGDFDRYLSTLTDDAYLVDDFLPWGALEQRLSELRDGIDSLQRLVSAGHLDQTGIASLLQDDPTAYAVLKELLAAPSGVGFSDRRRFPEIVPSDHGQIRSVARVLVELRLADLLPVGSNVRQLLTVALVGRDARRRGYRRRRSLELQTDELLRRAVSAAEDAVGEPLTLMTPAHNIVDGVPLPSVRRLVVSGGRPVAAIASIFEAQSGGRQTRNLDALVDTQRALNAVPAALIVVADGRGIRESRLALRRAWNGVAAIMSIQQARGGLLARAIEDAVAAGGLVRDTALSVDELVAARLRDAVEVLATDLPLDEALAELELARFAREHPHLALRIVHNEFVVKLRWERQHQIAAAIQLRHEFRADIALETVASIVRAQAAVSVDDRIAHALVDGLSHAILPERFAIFATDQPIEPRLIADIASRARDIAAKSTITILLVPDAGIWREGAEQAGFNRVAVTNVVVLDPSDLHDLAGAKDPRRGLAAHVLRQADLTKTSPFVFNGVTPRRVYTGRQVEQAAVVGAVQTNSVAVLGSRRIGKTSLMRRVEEILRGQGRSVYYADCEAIGDWEGLARLSRRLWKVDVSQGAFEPDLASELIEQLSTDGQPPVLLLDEIDRLVDWDRNHEVAGVPEAFFRQLRSLSQENLAQFVFSGERTIAERMWSSQSPHFNFCQRVDLRQLDRGSAESLLFDVLTSMGISVDDREAAGDLVWRATTGHPRMVQLIGDRLVRALNARSPEERARVALADFAAIVATLDYKREYLETYWGQADAFERSITHAVLSGHQSAPKLAAHLGTSPEDPRLLGALRMLELYGVLDVVDSDLRVRAEFLVEALDLGAAAAAA